MAKDEGVTILVSIHMDSSGKDVPTKTGMAVIYSNESGKLLGEAIIAANTIMPTRGVRADVRGLAIPKYSNGVGVIVEVGFINSPADRQRVKQNAGTIGRDIASGISAYIRAREK